MLRRELAGRRPGGRARRTFMDGVKEDVEMVGVRAKRMQRGGRGGGRRLDATPEEEKRV